jgi:hypothetical protein
MNYTIAYTYARGYFDGRTYGYEASLQEWFNEEERAAYLEGYDKGVTDYCEYDEGKQA